MTELDQEFTTVLGCRVRVVDAPEHLGPGHLLLLRVDDGRPQVEVYLSPDENRALRRILRGEAPDDRETDVAVRTALLEYAEAIREEEAQDALVTGFEERQAEAMAAAREARRRQAHAREAIVVLTRNRGD